MGKNKFIPVVIFKKFFLEKYKNTSYISWQKSKALMLIYLVLIPVTVFYFIINIFRSNYQELTGIIAIDLVFITAIFAGLYFLKSGRYIISVNLSIIMITALTIAGHIIKIATQAETGINSFSPLIFAALVFSILFGTRRVYISVAIVFLILTAGLHIYAINSLDGASNIMLLSGSLNITVAIIIIFFITMFINNITNHALALTQKELDKNLELNQTLELKVQERTNELKQSMEHIKVLKGMFPICAVCKKIRDDKGFWNQIETYIKENSEAEFTHGICPDCAKKIYHDLGDAENISD